MCPLFDVSHALNRPCLLGLDTSERICPYVSDVDVSAHVSSSAKLVALGELSAALIFGNPDN